VSGESLEAWGCGNQIFERSRLAFSYSSTKEPKPQSFIGSGFAIWTKQKDGSYKLSYSIWNLDFNPWEQ
jgi:hypothetical protein